MALVEQAIQATTGFGNATGILTSWNRDLCMHHDIPMLFRTVFLLPLPPFVTRFHEWEFLSTLDKRMGWFTSPNILVLAVINQENSAHFDLLAKTNQ